jgi:hypothetical protein
LKCTPCTRIAALFGLRPVVDDANHPEFMTGAFNARRNWHGALSSDFAAARRCSTVRARLIAASATSVRPVVSGGGVLLTHDLAQFAARLREGVRASRARLLGGYGQGAVATQGATAASELIGDLPELAANVRVLGVLGGLGVAGWAFELPEALRAEVVTAANARGRSLP